MKAERLDMLLRIAMEETTLEELEFCNSIERSPLLVSEQTQRKVYRMIKLSKISSAFKVGFNGFIKVAVACMLVITVAFSSAMCIKPIREAIVDAVVTWYDDHISFNFETEGNPDGNLSSTPMPTHLPDGWTIELAEENTVMRTYNILGPNGDYICYQQIFDVNNEQWIDNETEEAEKLILNDGKIVYLTYHKDKNMYNLAWCIGNTGFLLTGFDMDRDNILKIAASIE